MPISSPVLAKAAPLTGLTHGRLTLWGNYRGFPVSVEDATGSLRIRVRLTKSALASLAAYPLSRSQRKAAGLSTVDHRSALRFDLVERTMVYSFVAVLRVKPEDVPRELDALVALALRAGPPIGDRCEMCNANAGKVLLIEGTPMQLCEQDIAKFEETMSARQEVFMATPAGYGTAVLGGLCGMLIGAFLWAGVGIATQRLFGLAAVGIGLMIAFFLSLGAKRITWPMVGCVAVFTMCAIFFGDLIWLAAAISAAGGPFDLGAALNVYGEVVAGDLSLLLSYAFGAFGVISGGSWLASRKAQAEKVILAPP